MNLKISFERARIIWKLAWPVMFSQLLQTLLQIADMFFISQIGILEVVSAVGFSTAILGVIIVFSQLIATGSIALISRRVGEEKHNEVYSITQQALLLSIMIGLIIYILTSYISTPLLKGIGASGKVYIYGYNYLKIVLIGIPFMFFNLTGRAIIQAKGDTKTPMIIFVLMNIINIVFDPILIYGYGIFPELGYKGAALATLISNIIASLFMLLSIYMKVFMKKIELVVDNFKIDIKTMFKIIKIGFFSAIQAISRPITGLIMLKIASFTGDNAVAAFTIGGRIFNLVFILLLGLTTSISVIIGQNLGRKDIKKAEEFISDSLKMAAVNMLIFSLPYFVFSKSIMGIFIDDIEVIQIGSNYLRIVYLGLFFVIFPSVYGGVFMGAGDTIPPMIASLIANWMFKLPIAYIFAKVLNMGSNFVWISISISVLIEAIIIIIWFKKGAWKEKIV